MEQGLFSGDGPYLAVIDGRFLPLREFSIDIQHDVARQGSFTDSPVVQRGQSEMFMSAVTGRDPMMRDPHKITSRVFLYSKDYRLTISEINTVKYNMEPSVVDERIEYNLRVTATEWKLENRDSLSRKV